jgi:hypothetical protein
VANHIFPAMNMIPTNRVRLEAASSRRSSTRLYTVVHAATECQRDSPSRGSVKPSNEVYEDKETDDESKMDLMNRERFDHLLTLV